MFWVLLDVFLFWVVSVGSYFFDLIVSCVEVRYILDKLPEVCIAPFVRLLSCVEQKLVVFSVGCLVVCQYV